MNVPLKTTGLRRIAPYLLIIASLVLCSVAAFSQATTGDISGTVVDKTNSVIANAKVVATRINTNEASRQPQTRAVNSDLRTCLSARTVLTLQLRDLRPRF